MGGGDIERSGELNAMKYVFDKLLKKYGRELVLFDVGANVGDYSIELEKQFGTSSIIHSFEPSASTYQTLCTNMNNYSNVNCHNCGLSSEPSKMILYSNTEGSGFASVYKRRLDHFNINMDIAHECVFSTIDDFCREKMIDRIHFLKIDVEGHELSVLHGAKQMLSKKRIDYIQFEFGGCNIDSRTFIQDFWYLLSEKYKIYKIVPGGLYPIKEYKETLEIFVYQNFLAELK